MALSPFHALETGDGFVARTGYTGEDGWEILVPSAKAPAVWDRLLAAGVTPCGLGARDTLRLEAAMNLYGTDMDESVSPLESGLAWTVAFDPAEQQRRIVRRLLHLRGPCVRRACGTGATARRRRPAPFCRAPARGSRCAPESSASGGRRCRGRRDHERRLLADHRSVDRTGSAPGRRLRTCQGRRARQDARCAYSEDTFCASWTSAHRGLKTSGSTAAPFLRR